MDQADTIAIVIVAQGQVHQLELQAKSIMYSQRMMALSYAFLRY